MKRIFLIYFNLICLSILSATPALAEDMSNADILRREPRIQILEFNSKTASVMVEPREGKNIVSVIFKGKLTNKDYSLLYNITPIKLGRDGEFQLRIQIFKALS